MTKPKRSAALSPDIEYDATMLLQTVGVQLRAAMRAAHVTINQLAEKMVWTPERVIAVMDGKLDIDLRELVDLFFQCGFQIGDCKMKKPLGTLVVVKMVKR